MEESHIRQRIVDIKHDLDKLLSKDSMHNDVEAVRDMLRSIDKLSLSADIIAKTGMGNTIASLREKFSAFPDVAEQARDILRKWKAIMVKSRAKGQPEHSAHAAVHQGETLPVPKFTVPETAKPAPATLPALDNRKSALPSDRKSAVVVFAKIFKYTGYPRDETLALDIESAVHAMFQESDRQKLYLAKVKTLAFNLQKNKHLRDLLVSGHLTPEGLTKLSNSDLASNEIKVHREKVISDEIESRRLDWLETHKQDIQLDIGVDPNNSWQFEREDDEFSEPDADQPDA